MYTEKKLSGKTVFEGMIIDVHQDEVMLQNGSRAMREYCAHNGAVGVLAEHDGGLLLVRQYRYAVGRELLEIPAGKLEKGEEPKAAALRELREETGMECDRLVPLGTVFTSPGILSEQMHLYFADGLRDMGACPDEDELLSTVTVPLHTFFEMLCHGEISDSKTITSILLAKARGLI